MSLKKLPVPLPIILSVSNLALTQVADPSKFSTVSCIVTFLLSKEFERLGRMTLPLCC